MELENQRFRQSIISASRRGGLVGDVAALAILAVGAGGYAIAEPGPAALTLGGAAIMGATFLVMRLWALAQVNVELQQHGDRLSTALDHMSQGL